jgi:magnesium chelatase family protein
LLGAGSGEPSATVALRVRLAAERQLARQDSLNEALGGAELDRLCQPDAAAEKLLRSAMTRLAWSARSYHRVLRVARTIADLAGLEAVGQAQVAEAIQYRRAIRQT